MTARQFGWDKWKINTTNTAEFKWVFPIPDEPDIDNVGIIKAMCMLAAEHANSVEITQFARNILELLEDE